MSMRLDFEVESQLPRRLRGMKTRIADLREPFKEFDRSVGHFFRLRFITGGRHGSPGKWEPLAPETKERRQEKAGGNRGGVSRPLWDTGEMRASFVEVGPESVRKIGRQTYERGSRLPRAAIHQQGRGNVPQRRIVPAEIPSYLQSRAARLVASHVADG